MIATVVAMVLLGAGVFFLLTSTLGLLRLPTFYARTHAVGKAETVGAILLIAGLVVENGLAPGTPQLVLILVFALIANPTAVHAIARAARYIDEEPRSTEESA